MNGLTVLAKVPREGRVKTRFAADSSNDWALQLHEACLLDTLERPWPCAWRRLLMDDESAAWRARAEASGWLVATQASGGLGARIADALVTDDSAVDTMTVIGTDSPTLPESAVVQMLLPLEVSALALGPTADGGFYAIAGSARLRWGWLDACTWSSPRTLESVMRRARENALTPVLGPAWYDIDHVADLRRVVRQASALQPGSEHAYIGRHVRAFVVAWCRAHADWTA